MSLLVKQFKCAFKGHEARIEDVTKLNELKFNHDGVKEHNALCRRCYYPITLRKFKIRPYKYQIIER
jgi:hypothetical protein